MLSREEYIRKSFNNHLFWLRIMKEHAIFIQSAIPPSQRQLAQEAERFKLQFEHLLASAIIQSSGWVSPEVLLANELFTRYTDEAERITQQYTGIQINRNLTNLEADIEPWTAYSNATGRKEQEVSALNRNVLSQLEAFSHFKNSLWNSQVSCRIMTMLYTAVLQHVLHEAEEYIKTVTYLQNRQDPGGDTLENRNFWNNQMSEHAKAVRGLLDPSEAEMFVMADRYGKMFDSLIQDPARDPLEPAIELSEFKETVTRGRIECKIQGIILPLFIDHLLREANHYIRLLQS
ncbi:MAG: hypothetical protein BWY11_01285 [Firmicutes bacterium ADurb.Bin182]|nr:MAG: hypothetical protein BWY11_01285 [Firmicutes bacterium ADurb.Bin182]